MATLTLHYCKQAYQQVWRGEGAGGTSLGPPNFFLEKWPHETFIPFLSFWAAFFKFFIYFFLLSIAVSGLNE